MKQCFPMLYISILFWVLICPTVEAQWRMYNRRTKVMRGFGGWFSGDDYGRHSDELLPAHFELNSPCRSSYDCLSQIPYSQCDYDTRVCVCQNYHIAYNNTMCLPASLLGYPCILDAQCKVKVPHSRCIDGLCGCEPKHVPLRKDKCLPPAAVGDYCQKDQQCQYHSRYSYCKFLIPRIYGTCQCPFGYELGQNGYCLPRLGFYCEKHEDCEAVTPNSYCATAGRTSHCACLAGLEPTVDNMECIFDRSAVFTSSTVEPLHISLGKPCHNDQECQNRDPYSHCLNGTCECIAPDATCSAQNTGCHPGTFQCRNGYCISWYFVCDKTNNCADGSDEECERYNCPKEAFQCDDGTCLPRLMLCNGHWECPDGSDEARCYTGIPCDKNAFRCQNGQCKPAYAFCNAIKDCADGSDELLEVCDRGFNCSSIYKHSHQCLNGRCRSSSIACSGLDGCGDESDEAKCDVCYCKKP